ncbi:MAG TPA: glycosyltransferase family 4 protein [Dehalococcoidia bacterium]|nr:glycosyltransferase family 4 protein [Dehalococcoidia bacterium]
MKIAQIAPMQESVPPATYGGTERVVSWLIEELVRRGHDVTLFATGDSQTSATLVPVVPRALRPAGVPDYLPATMLAIGRAFERAAEFDVIHSHLDVPALPFAHLVDAPVVFTTHGRLDQPWSRVLYDAYADVQLVSVSDNQRRLLPHWNWQGTVYNGIGTAEYSFSPRGGDYLAFLGRISPEKGIEEAIQVARLAGIPLKIAAKIDPADRKYYEERVAPLLHGPLVEYVGEINQQEKDLFLGRALALLFPIRWPEPFGLVMAEAMATGTPVIAGRFGSVPEVIEDGRTGFICDSIEEMALAAERVAELDRATCRRVVEQRFSAATMAEGYEAIYRRLVQAPRQPVARVAVSASHDGDLPPKVINVGPAAAREGASNGTVLLHGDGRD